MDGLVHVIGGGLAGCEAAWQLASRGISVRLYEMRPQRMTPAHQSSGLAELVCSNSLKSMALPSAAATLKAELEIAGSMLLRCAQEARVAAGSALAVDRQRFSEAVGDALAAHPLVEVIRKEVCTPSEVRKGRGEAVIIATGPLTSDALSGAVMELLGQEALAFFDAAAPIVTADSLDHNIIFAQSRYGRSVRAASLKAPTQGGASSRSLAAVESDTRAASLKASTQAETAPRSTAAAEGDARDASPRQPLQAGCTPAAPNPAAALAEGEYLNAAFNREQYENFISALLSAQRVQKRSFEQGDLFSACQPIEEVARSGRDAPRFGALKPVGITDPATGRRPWAVAQLRAENSEGSAWNLVGFQTNLTFPEQQRVFRMIPGLEHAEFARFGVMHRNTFINTPGALGKTLEVPGDPLLRFAGQITGTEGYTEAIASGLFAALATYAELKGLKAPQLPRETVFGALLHYATSPETSDYQPMHVNYGIVPPLSGAPRKKSQRYEAYSERALAAQAAFREERSDLWPT